VSADSSTPRNGGSLGPGEKLSSLDLAEPDHALSQTNLPSHSSLSRWAHRISMLLFVSVCAVFGVLLVILPWTPKWTDNYVLISHPALRGLLENGFVRGMCTGLGALDIWIGFWEAMHYHERETRT
jgi:hypothetical protein